jgi:O-antigen ligase
MLLYPDDRTIRLIGTYDFSVHQVVVFAVLGNLLIKARRLETLHLNFLDVVMAFVFLGQWLAASTQMSLAQMLETQGNHFTKTGLVYVVVRLGITSHAEFRYLVSRLVYIALPLALMGAYESLTGHNMYDTLCKYAAGHGFGRYYPQRLGFHRAMGSFGNPIPWGLFFAAMLPLAFVLRGQPAWHGKRLCPALAILALGLFSSLSTAALYAGGLALIVVVLYPARGMVFSLGIVVLTTAAALQFFGPTIGITPPVELFSRFALDPNSAPYRFGLVQETLTGGMKGAWITGHGLVGIGVLDPSNNLNWAHEDFVNLYVDKLVRYGLVALIPFVIMQYCVFFRVGAALRTELNAGDVYAAWCVFAALFGWQAAFLTVAPVTQFLPFTYAIYALASGIAAADAALAGSTVTGTQGLHAAWEGQS